MKIYIFVFLLFMPLNVFAQSEPDFAEPLQTQASPVVVELFSSQNCPACPPADEYMGELAKSKGVIALSCHVDYFGKTSANFGREFCTDRQSKYIERIGRKSHFTPQMMINGHMSEIGYETQKVSAKLVRGRSERIAPIHIKAGQGGVYNFSLSNLDRAADAQLWLAVYNKPQNIKERGKMVTYHNVVSRYIPLGTWKGSALERPVFPITDSKSAGFAIVAQDVKSGKILAAGDVKL